MLYFEHPSGGVYGYDETTQQALIDSANAAGWPLADWPPQATLAQRRESVKERIKAFRDQRAVSGGYQVGGFWYHSDVFSRSQQMGLFMLGQNIPVGLEWKTMPGSKVPMSSTLASQIFSAASASDVALFAAAETHLQNVDVSESPETYDFSGGWPPVYGE